MKHHCHCGLKEHFTKFSFKKFGVFGAFLMVGHILFHVVECLIVPALLVAWSGHALEETGTTSGEEAVVGAKIVEAPELESENSVLWLDADTKSPLCLVVKTRRAST